MKERDDAVVRLQQVRARASPPRLQVMRPMSRQSMSSKKIFALQKANLGNSGSEEVGKQLDEMKAYYDKEQARKA